jgi:hypothetical protein
MRGVYTSADSDRQAYLGRFNKEHFHEYNTS